jgi:hypothetical protein
MTESLKPVRGVDVIRRGVFVIDDSGHAYAIEVDYFDFGEKVRLYRDGTHVEEKNSPATSEIGDDAVIEAKMGLQYAKAPSPRQGRREAATSRARNRRSSSG